MSLRPYKFQVIAICQQEEDGKVLGEQIISGTDGQPLILFGVAGLREFADGFEDQLAALQEGPGE